MRPLGRGLCFRRRRPGTVSPRRPAYPLQFLPTVEITHYGRVSSRQHSGYVTAHMAAGQVRYLRKAGYGRAAVWLYKLALRRSMCRCRLCI